MDVYATAHEIAEKFKLSDEDKERLVNEIADAIYDGIAEGRDIEYHEMRRENDD